MPNYILDRMHSTQPQYKDPFNQKKKKAVIKLLGLHMENIINESRIDNKLTLESTTLENPTWLT